MLSKFLWPVLPTGWHQKLTHMIMAPKWTSGLSELWLSVCVPIIFALVFFFDKTRHAEMIERERPNLGQNTLTALDIIAAYTTPSITNPKKLSPAFRDYLSKTLEVDAEERPDATQVLHHPFFAIAEPLRMLVPLIKAARERLTWS